MNKTIKTEEYLKNYSRPALRPSFICNIFHCKDEYTRIDEHNSYYECKRCGKRIGFSTFKMTFSIKI